MLAIKQHFPALPAYDAAMLNREYPELISMLERARKETAGLAFHGLLLHATPMSNVVGYGFDIDGHHDGQWFTSGEVIYVGKHGSHRFIEDALGRRLLLVSLAGENGAQCLDHKERHIAANREYFSGTRHAVFGLIHHEDASTIRAALACYVGAGMGQAENRTFEIQKLATGCPTGEGPTLDEIEIRTLAAMVDPNGELAFDAVKVNLTALELASIDAALHCYLDAGYGDPSDRPDHIHELATNTSPGALEDREVGSSYDDEAIRELISHIKVCVKRKAGWARP
ncbi:MULTISPECIES: hypothetical protein [Pseudomonas]|uniref:Uncharacterized protein n=1 Tax=Pseudomonas fluorescens TaxID=294 RepID=A0A161XF79_PSEFL|nr:MULTISPECIES: hypothetical protein [Pseudomonas]KZN20418.1 hypothetical protein A1D17_02445 [Pseudomonas fluorescens]